jgi:hypothetical protein
VRKNSPKGVNPDNAVASGAAIQARRSQRVFRCFCCPGCDSSLLSFSHLQPSVPLPLLPPLPAPVPLCSSLMPPCTCPSPCSLLPPPFDPAVALATSLLSFSCSPYLCRCLCRCWPCCHPSPCWCYTLLPSAGLSSAGPLSLLLPFSLCATPLVATPPRPCSFLSFSVPHIVSSTNSPSIILVSGVGPFGH